MEGPELRDGVGYTQKRHSKKRRQEKDDRKKDAKRIGVDHGEVVAKCGYCFCFCSEAYHPYLSVYFILLP